MKCLLIIENTDYSGVFSLPVTFRFIHILEKKTRIKKYELSRTFFNSIIAIHKQNLLTIFFGQVSIIEHLESKRKL